MLETRGGNYYPDSVDPTQFEEDKSLSGWKLIGDYLKETPKTNLVSNTVQKINSARESESSRQRQYPPSKSKLTKTGTSKSRMMGVSQFHTVRRPSIF